MDIIPLPVKMVVKDGVFVVDSGTVIVADEATEGKAEQLCEMLKCPTGFELTISTEEPDGNCIVLEIDGELGSEAYKLSVTAEGVRIVGGSAAGIFYGIQTLRQLLPVEIFSDKKVDGIEWSVSCVEIADEPRFGWRGAMLDCARHFMPKEFVKKFIDLLAMHKMNSFHWHLTEDQGWRIEIKKYPKLTEVGAWRKETVVGHLNDKPWKFDGQRHGGFYTQDDVRQIVAYAAERHINIMPEIEMPGHAQAAIAAYPEIGNTGEQLEVCTHWGVIYDVVNAEESTILFYQDILAEVLELFPSEFIHVGADEVPKDQWKASAKAQTRIKELGLKDEDELQSYFIRRMDSFLTSKGRRLVGWDEILEGGLADNATVMSWRGEAGGIAAAKQGHDVVMAPRDYVYFDYYQAKEDEGQLENLAIGGLVTLETVYSYEPIPAELTEEEAKHVLGGQCQVWTEYIPTPERVEYMLLPRMSALCEVLWTPAGNKDYDNFYERLGEHVKRLGLMDVNYRKLSK